MLVREGQGNRLPFSGLRSRATGSIWRNGRSGGITAIEARRCNCDSHSASRELPKRRIRRGTTSSRGAVAFDREVAFVIGAL